MSMLSSVQWNSCGVFGGMIRTEPAVSTYFFSCEKTGTAWIPGGVDGESRAVITALEAVGPLGEWLGPSVVLGAGGAIGLALVGLGFLIPDVWRLRALEGPG